MRFKSMIALVFSACLITSPTDCREYHIPFTDGMTKGRCYMVAQTELAKWVGEHLNHSIKRFSCEDLTHMSKA